MSGKGRQPARKVSGPPQLQIHSNRTSSSYASSNRRRSSSGTPSSSASELPPKSVVELTPPPSPIPKKKVFSFLAIFKRNKKKGQVIDSETAAAAAALAEIKAEEIRLLHEEEFIKLRKQREKDRSRSLYDMLPNPARLTRLEQTPCHPPSPTFPTPRASRQSPVLSPTPRMRSVSNTHHTSRPTSHCQSQLPMVSPRSSLYAYSGDAHRSAEFSNRTISRSPLAPARYEPRPSFYALPTHSHSHLTHQPLYPISYNHRPRNYS
ncbi:hypothetical protein L0F63_005752 [Massospora cicadina]|nr:hypothetical protein L0F63_005752 [Massospora cicadina]